MDERSKRPGEGRMDDQEAQSATCASVERGRQEEDEPCRASGAQIASDLVGPPWIPVPC